MEQKAFTLQNKGMNRDLSISKAGESSAYTNKNIRIEARDNDTLLSVTNERGTLEISLADDMSISGDLLGWNVLNNHLILFTHDDESSVDRIYRVDFSESESQACTCLFEGDLGFDMGYPIESVVYFETEDIQKIYWVDGKNVLRFMNFMDETTPWISDSTTTPMTYDNTYFDSNRQFEHTVSVSISKDNSGNSRPNGVIQYLLTYFNKHGQETAIAWVSDLVYLSPVDRGGAADETNNNKVKLTISGLDTSFDHFRIYSVFRSSINGSVLSYLVSERETSDSVVYVIDDNANQILVDSSSLLYLGSKNVKVSTLTHKDETLFLGDITSIGNQYNETIKSKLNAESFVDGSDWESSLIEFVYSGSSDDESENTIISDIPNDSKDELYPYHFQLQDTSSKITGFKGGEKYRFALKFVFADGSETDAIWIGDKINSLYPVIDNTGDSSVIKRVLVKCIIPADIVVLFSDAGSGNVAISGIQLLFAEATYSDRLVLAQGIINPTVFNVWERYNDRLYSSPSWITRPRNSGISSRHFEVIKKSNTKYGEIQCNYWNASSSPKPYYRYSGYSGTPEYMETFDGEPDSSYYLIVYKIRYRYFEFQHEFHCKVYVYGGNVKDQNAVDVMKTASMTAEQDSAAADESYYIKYLDWASIYYKGDDASSKVYYAIKDYLVNTSGIPVGCVVKESVFLNWCEETKEEKGWNDWVLQATRYWTKNFSGTAYTSHQAALDEANGGSTPSALRWDNVENDIEDLSSGNKKPAYYKKHLMFIDENMVTLESPEIKHEMFNYDNANYKFRIVGAARFSSIISDYSIDASHGYLDGENTISKSFSGLISDSNNVGLFAAKLWRELGLELDNEAESKFPEELTQSDYTGYSGNSVEYWLHMWHHSGSIDEFNIDDNEYSVLNEKHFANHWISDVTVFGDNDSCQYTPAALRESSEHSNKYLGVDVFGKKSYYSGTPQLSLFSPGSLRYPLLYSNVSASDDDYTPSSFLTSVSPITIEYSSGPHAVIELPGEFDNESHTYVQSVLPRLNGSASTPDVDIPVRDEDEHETGALLPWVETYLGEYDARNILIYNNIPALYNVGFTFDYINSRLYFNVNDDNGGAQLYNILQVAYNYFTSRNLQFYIRVLWGSTSSVSGYLLVKVKSLAEGTSSDSDYRYVYYTESPIQYESGQSVYSQLFHYMISDNEISSIAGGYDFYPVSTEYIAAYYYNDYDIIQNRYYLNQNKHELADSIDEDNDEYLLMGEIYRDSDPEKDYGGKSDADIQNCHFIPASQLYQVSALPVDEETSESYIYGNMGDTYFQRWDDVKTKPYSSDAVNQVTDIVSFMVESHINLDGRTDTIRGTGALTELNLENYDSINPVYSQQNNFFSSRDLDEDFDLDTYRSSLTWTLQKSDSALVDEWSHITLASSLKLDGDMGKLRALRRFGNSIFAFQDRGISEVLFNSRTQLSTTDGTPVEIANSGKVDGKRYITNKYGCINKWSIVEGKAGLYFVDDINKSFCSISTNGLKNISSEKGFNVAFRRAANNEPWTPENWNNTVLFYDRIHSDVYLVGNFEDGDCLVYNEMLDAFTSFFSYQEVPMMVNVDGHFVAFKKVSGNTGLWYMNEGYYGDFFGTGAPFSVTYRVTPNPFGDKIWTNIEYRADVFDTSDNDIESELIDGIGDEGLGKYLPEETFDSIVLRNEYQESQNENSPDLKKKFRIWRYVIPRAKSTTTNNKFGLDRMRSPWVNIKMSKSSSESTQDNHLMQMHDAVIYYFE